MSKSELLETLQDLAENRRMSFEVGELIAPFKRQVHAMSLSLVSSSKTLGNRFGPEYDGGDTLTCKLEGGELEVDIQTTANEGGLVKGLVPGASFEMQLGLLDFDALYQRAVFGSQPGTTKPSADEAAAAPDKERTESTPPAESTEASEEETAGEPATLEPAAPEKLIESPIDESIPTDEAEEALRRERRRLLVQLNQKVEAQTTPSRAKAVHTETAHSKESSRVKDPAPTKPEAKAEEKQRASNILFVIGIFAFFGILGLLVENNPSPQGDETKPLTFDERMDWYRRNAMAAVAKTELQEEDRRALRGMASILFDECYTKVPRWATANTPAPSMEALEELTEAYAWQIIALEADGHTTRGLFKNSQRKHPFHWLEDRNVIEAKARAALRTPHLALEGVNLLKVTELDLSNEELKDLGYLTQLPSLQVLNLANNPIEDLKPLIHLKKLKNLDLSGTNPKDLAPLQEIESLQLLTLNRSESQLTQLEQLKKARPDLQITLTDLTH